MKKGIKTLIFFMITLIFILTLNIGTSGYLKYKDVVHNIGIEEKILEIRNSDNYIKINHIDTDFLKAIVAIEDHRFYEHNGLDFVGITRAIVSNIREGKIVQGGSTITQQLVKNIYLDEAKNYSRKVAEVFLVNKIEKTYSKDEILEVYVNAIDYGNGYIGIKDASNGYFDVLPENLNYEQATILAGIPQYPEGYNLTKYYDRALNRQELVIEAINKYNKKTANI